MPRERTELELAGDPQRPANRSALPRLAGTTRARRSSRGRALHRATGGEDIRAAILVRVRAASRRRALVGLVRHVVAVRVRIACIAERVAVHVRLVAVRQAGAVVEAIQYAVVIA